MRFWDSSAVVPLCIDEPFTENVRELFDKDAELAVWWATPVECAAAFARRRREGALTELGYGKTLVVFDQLFLGITTVSASSQVRTRARRLVSVHTLRAADALQLAAALIWAEESPTHRELVTLDRRLSEAALLEGFDVLPKLGGVGA